MDDFWIEMGWYKKLRGGRRKLVRGNWMDPLVREDAVRFLIEEVLKKSPRDLTARDFAENGLQSLLNYHCHGCVYEAVAMAGYEIEPWEMRRIPKYFFKDPEARKQAVGWLMNRLGKDARDVREKDFKDHGLSGLLQRHYHSSPYEALREVGYELEPWEMHQTPHDFFESPDNRKRALQWLVRKLGKDPRRVSTTDFKRNGLSALIARFSGVPFRALRDAGHEIEPWEMADTPDYFFQIPENRRAAVKWLLTKLGKGPRDITSRDFDNNGLGGLLARWYSSSPYKAVTEAGYDIYPWEMKRTCTATYSTVEKRRQVLEWLLEKTGKSPEDLSTSDFTKNGLVGLLNKYRQSPYEVLKSVGLVNESNEYYMRNRGKLRT